MNPMASGRSPLVLAYHSVSDTRQDGLAVRTADFRRQMRWLAENGYRSVTLADFISQQKRNRDKSVVITFDDGYRDNYTTALPVLREVGFVATVFVVSDMIGSSTPFWWDMPKVDSPEDAELFHAMSWSELSNLVDAGFEIGSHTCSHPDAFATLDAKRCWRELNHSRELIESRLKRTVTSFSYPRGSVDDRLIEMVRRAGYECAVVTPPRYGIPRSRFTMRRVGIYRENNDLVFRLKTSSVVQWLSENSKRYRRPIPAICE